HLIHGAVKHALRRRLLAVPHHRADKLLDEVVSEDRVDCLLSPAYQSFAWHCVLPLLKISSLLRDFFASLPLTLLLQPSAAWLHTSSVPACDSRRLPRPAFRARCDSARPADPSRGRRARARWSV